MSIKISEDTIKNIRRTIESYRFFSYASFALKTLSGILLIFSYLVSHHVISVDKFMLGPYQIDKPLFVLPCWIPIVAIIININIISGFIFCVIGRLVVRVKCSDFSFERIRIFYFTAADCISLLILLAATFSIFLVAFRSIWDANIWLTSKMFMVVICYAINCSFDFFAWLYNKNLAIQKEKFQKPTAYVDCNNNWIKENDLVIYKGKMYRAMWST